MYKKYIDKSFSLASNKGYLDELYRVYPFDMPQKRIVNNWNTILSLYNSEPKEDILLLRELLKLKKFPIDNSYIAFLRKDEQAIYKNPVIVSKILEAIHSYSIDELKTFCEEPKKASRQLGQSFTNWLYSLTTVKSLNKEDFNNYKGKEAIILQLPDNLKEVYLQDMLGYNIKEYDIKIPDLIAKKGNTFFIGEAKFITNTGGSQDNQIHKSINVARVKHSRVVGISILDGYIWLQKEKIKME